MDASQKKEKTQANGARNLVAGAVAAFTLAGASLSSAQEAPASAPSASTAKTASNGKSGTQACEEGAAIGAVAAIGAAIVVDIFIASPGIVTKTTAVLVGGAITGCISDYMHNQLQTQDKEKGALPLTLNPVRVPVTSAAFPPGWVGAQRPLAMQAQTSTSDPVAKPAEKKPAAPANVRYQADFKNRYGEAAPH